MIPRLEGLPRKFDDITLSKYELDRINKVIDKVNDLSKLVEPSGYIKVVSVVNLESFLRHELDIKELLNRSFDVPTP